jgi:hypothetical protein
MMRAPAAAARADLAAQGTARGTFTSMATSLGTSGEDAGPAAVCRLNTPAGT